ncbi:MAG: tetratricopeptide repeat protein [Cyanobacteria bacterium P01_F01_bin.150]
MGNQNSRIVQRRLTIALAASLICAVGAIIWKLPKSESSELSENVLLRVEKTLKEGDSTWGNDSPYDEYVIEGQAGDTISITLESIGFDTYLVLADEDGEWLAENDDIPSDIIAITRNSWITVTLPTDGEYRIQAGTSPAWGQGDYRLTVISGESEPVLSDVALRQSEALRLQEQGIQQIKVSQFRESLESSQAALDIFREIGDRAGEAYTLWYLGDGHSSLGQYQQAIDLYEQALTIVREIGDRAGEAYTLWYLGDGHSSLGQYQQAIDRYEQALTIVREVDDRTGEGGILEDLGAAYGDLGQYQQAIDRYEQALTIVREVDDRAAEGGILGNLGIVYGDLGQYQQAIDRYEQALTIVREVDDRAAEVGILGNLGIVYSNLGQYQQAIDFHEQALTIAREIGNRDLEGTVLGNSGTAYSTLGQYQQAIDFHEQALTIAREIGNRSMESAALVNLGNAHDYLGQYQQAIDFYEQALTIARETNDRAQESAALVNLGNVYIFRGQYQQAFSHYEQALTTIYEINNRRQEGATLGNLGHVYLRVGQYQKSINLYNQYLTIARELKNRADESIALANLGVVYNDLGQYRQAIDFHRQSLAITQEIGDRNTELSTRMNLSASYRNLGQYRSAIAHNMQSLLIAREIGNRASEGSALGNLGLVHRDLGQYRQAIAFHEQSLTIAHEIGDRNLEANSLANLGSLYRKLGQHPEAMERLQQSLAIYQALESTVNTERAVTSERGLIMAMLSRIYRDQEKPELAIVFLKEAINVWETIRTGLRERPQEELLSYTNTVVNDYRQLVELLLSQGRIMEALQVLDLLKVQELQDFFKDVNGNERTSQGIELLPEEQQFWDALDIEQLDQYAQSSSTTALMEQLRQTASAQNLSLKAYKDLQTRLKNLGTNSALFYPLILEDSIELVLFTRNAPPVNYSIPVSQATLEAAVQSFRADLEDPSSQNIEASAQKLYNWLIKPIKADLQNANIETIIYAPDGQMRYVPLAALHDGQQWLTETYQVNYITALSLTDIEPEALDNPQILAGAFSGDSADVSIGAKTFSFGSIPFAETEVETLASIFPNTTKLLDTAFNRDAVASDRMNAHNIVHFATHGKLVSGNPEESFILLNNGEYVTLREIRDWNLPNVALVVLSACQTALGDRLSNGIEVIGFGYQLQQAQARASISTLWEISDGGTNSLMNGFYRLLGQENMTQVEALRQAQIAMITGDYEILDDESRTSTEIRLRPGNNTNRSPVQLNHPYYWAPFILIGNGL